MSDTVFDIKDILSLQANRYPMLFIDRVVSCVPGKSSTCIKNFTYNEWFFPVHYEDDPNAPGFVLIESLVQSFLVSFLSLEKHHGARTNFLDVKNASFRRKIIPGDVLTISSELVSFKRGIAKGTSKGFVEDALACSAEFIVCIPEIMETFRPK
jgi:3-hydroxyacyl-[acyl-carrier-protein] dehydratase